ncbi:SusC/RagA family TonB-linked outer membrane protein [Hymenobacter rubidus]|uniref:SusC/RagA family TonB-linked outer membrane protein n=1 Tax=Hymenobacter rubidus TaxID=1441626 RepID=UPI00191F91A7|nr:SusC/RagA family TonB-linked outer membrane protein [Hymenobacter rubidus]
MKKSLLLIFALIVALLQQAQAQDRTISGKVSDRATNQGLPGVTVLAKGTTVGTSTNADGGYTLSVPSTTTTLTFSFIGYASQEVNIGSSNNIDITLATDTKQLNEVVVTALGVERTRNSLAFSATQIEGSDITVARNPNPINSLSGKVAGLAITQSNTLGGSSNVVIRGTKSIGFNNQALFVVDGVPISNSNTNSANQQTGRGGYDYGNAASDINPDDIATTTVLKGAAATALYGERAANGVILITTKKGRKGRLGVNVNSGVTFGKIDKSTFITYQKQYGEGYGKFYGPAGNEFFDHLSTDPTQLVVPAYEDGSFGAAYDPNLKVRQWYSFVPGSPTFGQATPWVTAANDPSTFFQTAVGNLNSITIDGGSESGTFKLGYSNNTEKGILPNSKVGKNIVNFAGSFNVTPKLTVSASVNYSRTTGLGRYGTGYGSGSGAENQMTLFRQWWANNVDIKELENAYNLNKTNATWNQTDPANGNYSPIFWNNPYFSRYENYENDSRNRTFGNVAATYKFTNWFNVLGRVTADTYDEQQEERNAVGAIGLAYYHRYNRTAREYNYDLIGNFDFHLSENFALRGLIGANMNRINNQSIYASTNGGLVVPRLYSLSNSAGTLTPPTESVIQVGRDGVFANATLGYRERLFLDLSIRRDKSTTLPLANNTYVYPSAALGYVFSEDLKEKTPWLSYGKIRVNYAQVGSGAPQLAVYDIYTKPTAFGNNALFALPTIKNNADLKPELTRSGEAGIEASFLDSRVGFDVTVYQQNTINQIIAVDVSQATGYNSRFINAGEVRNRGIEVSAYVMPVRNTNGFNWRINANFTHNDNRVVSLTQGSDNIQVATYQGGISSNATVGQPFGVLRGSDFVYKDGQKVISATTGYYLTAANQNIANPNARWRGGVTNTVSYKSVSLSFLVDVRSGGQIFSLDRYYGLAIGQSPETAELNDLGKPSRLPLAEGGGIILPGVLPDGTPNTKRVTNAEYGLYGYRRNPAAAFVYDASFVKLREVALTFSLPQSVLSHVTLLKAVDFSIIGRNLWIIHKNTPYSDPEDGLSSGNLAQGYQSGSYPATRTLGANLRLSF